MITIKTPEEIVLLREGGRRLSAILKQLGDMVVPGLSTLDIDTMARKLIEEGGDTSAFLDYQPDGAPRPFPASVCVSINEEVVHGIPNEKPRILKEGDIVSIDLGLIHKNLITDSAITVPVGKIDKESTQLLEVTKNALMTGIKAAKAGAHVGDIGFAIQEFVKPYGYGHAEGLSGHGVGYAVHEDPYVPNTGTPGQGALLKEGMIIAIEPMLNLGTGKVLFDKDGYTVRTKDGKRSAHFEHTIVITKKGSEVLT